MNTSEEQTLGSHSGLRLYTVAETAKILKLHHETVRTLIRNGTLSASDLSHPGSRYRRWRVSEEAIGGYLLTASNVDLTVKPRARRRVPQKPLIPDYASRLLGEKATDGHAPLPV